MPGRWDCRKPVSPVTLELEIVRLFLNENLERGNLPGRWDCRKPGSPVTLEMKIVRLFL